MKKLFALLLVMVLLAVPVLGNGNLVRDREGLLSSEELIYLEQLYTTHGEKCGYTPILLTTPSFEGQSPETYAGEYYDTNGYPYDGILLLVSLTEGQWYILTNGTCYDNISNDEAWEIGENLVPYLREGQYYEAFVRFTELAAEAYTYSDSSVSVIGGADGPTSVYVESQKNYGKTIAISMGVGLLIGLIAVGIMASMMKSVRPQNSAGEYVRKGSMQLTNQRDIYLYSHVSRTPKPQNNSSGGSGGSRGGAGGRI